MSWTSRAACLPALAWPIAIRNWKEFREQGRERAFWGKLGRDGDQTRQDLPVPAGAFAAVRKISLTQDIARAMSRLPLQGLIGAYEEADSAGCRVCKHEDCTLARKGKRTHHAVVGIARPPRKGDGVRRMCRFVTKARMQRKYIDASGDRFFGIDIVRAIAVAKIQQTGSATLASHAD